jgi:hypothetical protein
MPLQPIEFDDTGEVIRFRENKIVRYLLDAGPFDLNHLACVPGFSVEDEVQFAQLIGYSVSGFGELSYVHGTEEGRAALTKADMIAEEVANAKEAVTTMFQGCDTMGQLADALLVALTDSGNNKSDVNAAYHVVLKEKGWK